VQASNLLGLLVGGEKEKITRNILKNPLRGNMDFEQLLNAARFRPDRLVFPDAWIGHIPFAAWLVKTLRPSIFVELGTHSGNSYLAICQAVVEAGLSTRCYAVDTWKGDEHAGFYDETVFQKLVPYIYNIEIIYLSTFFLLNNR
jgi:hypothetical protein